MESAPSGTPVRDRHSGESELNYILVLVGSVSFLYLVGLLFGMNYYYYSVPHLRQLNPQALSGVWTYGIQLVIGVSLLSFSILGMVFRSRELTGMRWTMLFLVILSLAYFACILGRDILFLFFDEFFIGIGLVFMLVGTSRNALMMKNGDRI